MFVGPFSSTERKSWRYRRYKVKQTSRRRLYLFLNTLVTGQVSAYFWLYSVCWFSGGEFQTRLTEHQLQPHKAGHKVIKVDGEVSISVAGHQNLVDVIVQSESCRKQQERFRNLTGWFWFTVVEFEYIQNSVIMCMSTVWWKKKRASQKHVDEVNSWAKIKTFRHLFHALVNFLILALFSDAYSQHHVLLWEAAYSQSCVCVCVCVRWAWEYRSCDWCGTRPDLPALASAPRNSGVLIFPELSMSFSLKMFYKAAQEKFITTATFSNNVGHQFYANGRHYHTQAAMVVLVLLLWWQFERKRIILTIWCLDP